MADKQLVAAVLITVVICASLLGLVGALIADGQNWRSQCVAAGGYVATNGSGTQAICVR